MHVFASAVVTNILKPREKYPVVSRLLMCCNTVLNGGLWHGSSLTGVSVSVFGKGFCCHKHRCETILTSCEKSPVVPRLQVLCYPVSSGLWQQGLGKYLILVPLFLSP